MNIKSLLLGSAAALAAVSVASAAHIDTTLSKNVNEDLTISSNACTLAAPELLAQGGPKADYLKGPNATGTGGGPNEIGQLHATAKLPGDKSEYVDKTTLAASYPDGNGIKSPGTGGGAKLYHEGGLV